MPKLLAYVLVVIATTLLATQTPAPAGQLRPEILVEQYLLELEMAVDGDDHAEAVRVIENLRAMKDQVTLPPELEYHYANSLFKTGQTQKAHEAVFRYLEDPAIDQGNISAALRLKIEIEKKLREEEKQREDRRQVREQRERKRQMVAWFLEYRNVLRAGCEVTFSYDCSLNQPNNNGKHTHHHKRHTPNYDAMIERINSTGLGDVKGTGVIERLDAIAFEPGVWDNDEDRYEACYYLSFFRSSATKRSTSAYLDAAGAAKNNRDLAGKAAFLIGFSTMYGNNGYARDEKRAMRHIARAANYGNACAKTFRQSLQELKIWVE